MDQMGNGSFDVPIGAQGIALVKSIFKEYRDKPLEILPFAVQWKLANTAMDSKCYTEHKEQSAKIMESITPEVLTKGITDILSGKPFRIRTEINGVKYLILTKPEENMTVTGIEDENIVSGFTFSSNYRLVVSIIDGIGTDNTLLKEAKFKMIADMGYLDFLILVRTYNGIANKLYGLDWSTAIKN